MEKNYFFYLKNGIYLNCNKIIISKSGYIELFAEGYLGGRYYCSNIASMPPGALKKFKYNNSILKDNEITKYYTEV